MENAATISGIEAAASVEEIKIAMRCEPSCRVANASITIAVAANAPSNDRIARSSGSAFTPSAAIGMMLACAITVVMRANRIAALTNRERRT